MPPLNDGGEPADDLPEIDIEAPEGSAETQGEDGDEAEIEWEELEIDGLKFAAPKGKADDLRAGFLKNKDYTTKTQELAEARKSVEAEKQAVAAQVTAQQEYLRDVAGIERINDDLDKYGAFTPQQWDQLFSDNQREYHAHQRNMQLLKDRRNAAIGALQQKDSERRASTQRENAKRIEDGRAAVAKEIPGWTDEAEQNLKKFAISLGFSENEFADGFADLRVMKLINWARVGKEAATKSTAGLPPVAGQKPLNVVGRRATPPPKSGLADNLTTAEWIARRTKQATGR